MNRAADGKSVTSTGMSTRMANAVCIFANRKCKHGAKLNERIRHVRGMTVPVISLEQNLYIYARTVRDIMYEKTGTFGSMRRQYADIYVLIAVRSS